jgi:hypothetical protein
MSEHDRPDEAHSDAGARQDFPWGDGAADLPQGLVAVAMMVVLPPDDDPEAGMPTFHLMTVTATPPQEQHKEQDDE